ncbi:hypothetical protein EYZ11_006736 [Aspergillus tanneri]|uniref:Aspergillopepsin-1 n=1 Tax=Aspergillus tanneri TaxID=1220188 RepID=A0A4S3JF31_9EURO|nr:uncharacterized protein ATNIH1004_004131 [Aspergillus tanneri]KAA8648248.1 hypothetical protein ATNIH1004_004131 [Aspergillus tanneri]THC93790.1 hypothetical protein EYZ11_006736 [Aspergillus tanneri]
MELLLSFLFALFFTSGVISAPTSHQHKGRSYKVGRIRAGNGAVDGPVALRKAYRKYNIIPSDLGVDLPDFKPLSTKPASANKLVSEPEKSGSVSAVSVAGDVAFVSPVTVGGQKLVLNLDTGSADFWLMNSRIPKGAIRDRTRLFHPENSSTFEDMPDASFDVSYGDSSYAFGRVGTDTVNMGGAIVKKQAIGLPDQVSDSLIGETYDDGLVGLSFSSINTVRPQRQKTFFENVAKDLDVPVFTTALKSSGVGEYEFGAIDHSKYTGDISNVTVDPSRGFWEFEAAHFAVGNGTVRSTKTKPTAIADTGTSLMLLDQEVVDAYYKQVPGAVFARGASGYIHPCKADMPNLSIAVGPKHLATVPGHFLSFSVVGTNITTGEKVCYGGVQSNQGGRMQILGDVFLKAFFVIFDLRGPSLGIASLKQPV